MRTSDIHVTEMGFYRRIREDSPAHPCMNRAKPTNIARVPSPAAPLQATQPGLLELIHDGDAMRLWELVRIQDAPVSVQDLATASGFSAAKVQSCMDELVRQGLLRAIRARKPRVSVGYRTARDRIVIGFDRGSRDIQARLRELSHQSHADWAHVTEQFADETPNIAELWRFNFVGFDRLSPEDVQELRRRIRAVCEFWNLLGSRTEPKGRAATPLRKRTCNHAMQIRVQPLREGLLALPEMWIIPNSDLEREEQANRAGSGFDALAPREREVARALSMGQSRKRVAAQLGISVNTVGTLAKRIFAKMGVRKAAELAARLPSAASRP
jgi:DNA-binding CsgD family transcriptional regulator/DNA-binding Lrp family transcriptional regulator